ncbi:hypothetical protein POVWA2_016000 [Plasmodium ovale wallikeri]|uniref:Uncharacterized protein n=1 Tax=Plasmodium ovale wallikeri TaxID=864142 RepID=A0A1A8Z377_PLAOA|nr:hypothetical protein POVWA2_016000 [Plasmodium ovale wallikeri]SBT38281.1 hypothetical protein POVWA1_037830 [Plasmodium ovale wallikeri]
MSPLNVWLFPQNCIKREVVPKSQFSICAKVRTCGMAVAKWQVRNSSSKMAVAKWQVRNSRCNMILTPYCKGAPPSLWRIKPCVYMDKKALSFVNILLPFASHACRCPN